MTLEEVEELQEKFRVIHCEVNYTKFLHEVLLTTERQGDSYQENSWKVFINLCYSITRFDAEHLQRIIALGETKNE